MLSYIIHIKLLAAITLREVGSEDINLHGENRE